MIFEIVASSTSCTIHAEFKSIYTKLYLIIECNLNTDVLQIILNSPKALHKSFVYDFFSSLLGKGLITAPGMYVLIFLSKNQFKLYYICAQCPLIPKTYLLALRICFIRSHETLFISKPYDLKLFVLNHRCSPLILYIHAL